MRRRLTDEERAISKARIVAYRKSPEGRAKNRADKARYQARHPERIKAQAERAKIRNEQIRNTPEDVAEREKRQAEALERKTPEAIAERKRITAEKAKANYLANKEKLKPYYARRYQENKADHYEKQKAYRANSEGWKQYDKDYKKVWRSKNRHKANAYIKAYKTLYPERYKASRRKSERQPRQRLVRSLRRRLREFFHGRVGGCMGLCGCTREHLMQHIEAQFTKRMNWNNYGAWHVDHIMPCASFDLSDSVQRAACFNWLNLRPLWAEKNVAKGDNITHPQAQLVLTVGTDYTPVTKAICPPLA